MEHTCADPERLPSKDMDGTSFIDETECEACDTEQDASRGQRLAGLLFPEEEGMVTIPRSLFNKLLSQPFYVGVVGTSRHYGGPEEGGWYYDWCDVEECEVANSWKEGMELVRRFRNEYPTQKYGRHSVLGNGQDTQVLIERSKSTIESWQSEERPHYE